MNTVNPLSSVPPVGSASADSGGRGQSAYQPRQGQIFKAMVTEALGQNRFVLDIGGTKVTAQARAPVNVGQTLQLQVMSTSPQVQLQILSDSANLLAGKSITLLGDNVNIQALFQALRANPSQLNLLSTASRQTLESFSHFTQDRLTGSEGGNLLKNYIDRLGLSLEALLAKGEQSGARNSLKAALLEMAQIFKSADNLSEATGKILGTLELYQLAQLQLDKENIFLFPLPLPFLEKGYLLVEDHGRKQKGSEDERDRFSLHLTLVGLGNLRVDIFKSTEGIYLRFFSDTQEKLDFLQTFKDELLPRMVESNILGISFSVEPIDTAADLLKRLLPEGESMVNTKV